MNKKEILIYFAFPFFMINYSAILNFQIEIKRQEFKKIEKSMKNEIKKKIKENEKKILILWVIERVSFLERASIETKRQFEELKNMIEKNKK